jgi:integrase
MRQVELAACFLAFVPARQCTLLGEVGESVKTAQAILGHSDIETTLNTYMHVIPDSQRRAVERVAGVLFPDVPKSPSGKQY